MKTTLTARSDENVHLREKKMYFTKAQNTMYVYLTIKILKMLEKLVA